MLDGRMCGQVPPGCWSHRSACLRYTLCFQDDDFVDRGFLRVCIPRIHGPQDVLRNVFLARPPEVCTYCNASAICNCDSCGAWICSSCVRRCALQRCFTFCVRAIISDTTEQLLVAILARDGAYGRFQVTGCKYWLWGFRTRVPNVMM